MKNTPKSSLELDSLLEPKFKTLIIKYGGRIRPILKGERASVETRAYLKKIQSEVKAEQKQIDHDVNVALMPVERISSVMFRAGFAGHEHIVTHYSSDEKYEWWCHDCPGYLNYKHCRHLDAVKLFIKNEGQTTLEAHTQ